MNSRGNERAQSSQPEQAPPSLRRRVRSAKVEARVTTTLRDLLLQPAVVEEALREYQALSGQRRRDGRAARAKQEAELTEVKRRAARLVDQVADGLLSGAAVEERLDALEVRRAGPASRAG